ncbi:MAG: YihY/virulence factor BrkB family protein [Candidatus Nanopelagicales bacterium]|jgi:membrane protein|nr:YihY/virulence factor BrkB family protein [Candidatus Nanopelagicales bacterium]
MPTLAHLTSAARLRWQAMLQRHPGLSATVDYLMRILKAQSSERLSLSAAGVAFWSAIAITPALIATAMIFSRLVNPQDLEKAVEALRESAPDSMGALLASQIQEAGKASTSTLSWGLVVSLITVLWAVSTAVYTLLRAVRMAYGLVPQSYVAARARAFASSLAIVLILGSLLLAAGAGSAWGASLPEPWRSIVFTAGIVLGLGLGTAVLTWTYRIAIGHSGSLHHWPGAAFGSLGTFAVFIGFGIYLSFATSYQAIYGALASSVILSIVLFVASYVILLGAVVNAELKPAHPA